MMKKLIYCFLVLFIGIFLIYLIFTWQIQKAMKSLPPAFQELTKLPTKEVENKLLEEATEYKEFVSPDGNFKMKYLSDWLEIPKETTEVFNQEAAIKGAETIFFAQKIKMKKMAFGSLVVQELEKEKWKNLRAIVEETKKAIEEGGGKVEIINLDSEKEIFEVKYRKEGQPEIYSFGRLFSGEKKVYLISFLTPSKDWDDFSKEIEEVANSVEIL